jgi:Transcriptional regulators
VRSSLRAVAERAEVSTSTVSRVLNNVDVPISPETQQRVRRIAAEMGYQPHRLARALATGCTQTVALWAANLRSAHYAQVVYFMRQEMLRHEYDLMISEAQPHGNGTLDTSRLRSWPVDGILAVELPRASIPGMEAKSLLAGKPFASMGVYVTQGADHVRIDFRDRVVEAVQHLHAVGCRRVAYLVPDWFEWFRQCQDDRLHGYEEAVASFGQAPEYILTADEKRVTVGPALKAYIASRGCPDGLFCFNDDMAIAAYRALRDLDRRIPEDVALIGCDGIEDTAYLDPPLTTIAQPLEEMCATAWAFLERRLREPGLPLQEATLQPTLQVRASSQR